MTEPVDVRYLSRRSVLRSVLAFGAGASWITHGVGCRDKRSAVPAGGEIVLYSSIDTDFLKSVVRAFEAKSGGRVLIAGDTEATKTTGLVQRLIAEKDRPRADVWWSSEALGTIKLSALGMLEGYVSESAERDFAAQGGWPAALRGEAKDWYGFALRPRVIVYNTSRVKSRASSCEQVLRGELGPCAMARPQFGTTRGHVGYWASRDKAALRDEFKKAKAAGLRLYDGNSSVVRAVSLGEAHVGITDFDDVIAGQSQGWPVELSMGDGKRNHVLPLCTTPCTAGLIKGGPNPTGARQLLDFLLSEEVETLLATSDSRNVPARPALASRYAPPGYDRIAQPDWRAVAASVDEGLKMAAEELGA